MTRENAKQAIRNISAGLRKVNLGGYKGLENNKYRDEIIESLLKGFYHIKQAEICIDKIDELAEYDALTFEEETEFMNGKGYVEEIKRNLLKANKCLLVVISNEYLIIETDEIIKG